MITQIEIDGFKTFKGFKVELAPFQVIVGPNGSGKSNLFDALHLLSRLAEKDIYTAFQELRGDAGELFMKYPDGKTSERIWIAVEMLLDRKGKDGLGREVTFEYRRLRYELEIVQTTQDDGLDQLEIAHEALRIIPIEEDSWVKKHSVNLQNEQIFDEFDDLQTLFSVTLDDTHTYMISAFSEFSHFSLRDEEDILNEEGPSYVSTEVQIDGTVLSSNSISSFLPSRELTAYHTIAVREMLRTLKFQHLNPEALRKPSSIRDPRYLASDGSNLPAVLARMQIADKYVIGDISREMTRLVPGILKIKVERDRLTDRYAIEAQTTDKRTFSSNVLSDGTLRLLALLTLKYDPQVQGALCLEEPENGVDPLHLPNMVQLLRSMATDFSDSEQAELPLRQVLITTHSPALVSMPEAIGSLLFTLKVTHIDPGKNTFQITRMVSVSANDTELETGSEQERDVAMESYTINQVLKYLNSRYLDEAQDRLTKRRSRLRKR